MNNKTISILKKELREVFRDKKSLSMMLLIPIMIPFIIIGIGYLFDSELDKSINEYNKIGFTYELSDAEEKLTEILEISPYIGTEEEIKEMYAENKIYAYIDKDNNKYIINYNKDNPEETAAIMYAENYLNQYKQYLQNNYLIENNINSQEFFNIIEIEHNNTGEEKSNFYANYITTYAFIFVIMAITISATYPATDATAGEKERGTLETLLTFPVSNKNIIIGKYLSVSLSSATTGILGFILSIFSLLYLQNNVSIYKDLNLLPSLPCILITILIIISYSLLISGLCISIASLSKTFKEAQSALTPITFIGVFPGMISFMAELKTTNLIAMIPFLNYVQIFNDVSKSNINITHILLMFISTIILIGIIFIYIIKQYSSEKILFNSKIKE